MIANKDSIWLTKSSENGKMLQLKQVEGLIEFKPVSEIFLEEGIEHITMQLDL